jgi:uncharacterized membrane protein YbhN (UPF0104 family)
MIFSKGRIVGLFCTIATLGGAIVVLLQTGSEGNLSKLESLLKANTLLPLFLLYSCHFLAEPARWVVYSRNAGPGRPQSRGTFFRIFACFNITALLSYSLPFKLGLPLRLFLLVHFLQIESAKVVKLMIMDGALSLLCWATIAVVLLFLLPEMSAFFLAYASLPVLLAAAALAGLVCLWLLRTKSAGLLALLRSISPAVAALVIVTLAADILLYGIRHMVLANMLGVDIAAEKIFVIGILAVFAGIISTLPMGLGAYDATLVALLALFGVGMETSLVLALCNRLGMIITSIILGVPSALALLNKNVKIATS